METLNKDTASLTLTTGRVVHYAALDVFQD